MIFDKWHRLAYTIEYTNPIKSSNQMTDITDKTGEDAIARFLDGCHHKQYPAKSMIIRQGDPSRELYYIVSGSVTVLWEDEAGHEIVLAYLNAGDFFGELGLFHDNQSRSALVRAKTACEVAIMSYERLRSMPEQYPDLLMAIAGQLAIRLRRTSRKVGDLAFMDVSGRVARALLDLCNEPDAMTHPDGMQIKITRQELGRIVGCSREMVGRVMKDLEERHLISSSGKTIVVFGVR